MTELYDMDIYGGYCDVGAKCLEIMMDNEIIKKVDQTRIGAVQSQKSILSKDFENFEKVVW